MIRSTTGQSAAPSPFQIIEISPRPVIPLSVSTLTIPKLAPSDSPSEVIIGAIRGTRTGVAVIRTMRQGSEPLIANCRKADVGEARRTVTTGRRTREQSGAFELVSERHADALAGLLRRRWTTRSL